VALKKVFGACKPFRFFMGSDKNIIGEDNKNGFCKDSKVTPATHGLYEIIDYHGIQY